MSRVIAVLLCSLLLPLTACQSSLRVAQATMQAMQDELAADEPSSWQRVAAENSGDSAPPVEPSLSRPAGALDLQGWPAPVAPTAARPPTALTPMATGSVEDHAKSGAAGSSPMPATPHADWAYAGPYGPENWGRMSPAFATCEYGHTQSPIELSSARSGALPELHFHYRPAPLHIVNNGHTLQFPQPPGSWLMIDGARYDLLQVHLHTPGEHAMGGEFAAMEIHFVHQNLHGQLAVVAVMAQPGTSHPLLARIASHAPKREGEVRPAEADFDPAALLPRDRRHVRYLGSLTTPPCSEGVAWHVLAQPIAAAKSDIAAMATIMPQPNSRPLQAVHDRVPVIN